MKSNISVDYFKKIETKSGCDKQFSLDTVKKKLKLQRLMPKIYSINQIKHRKKYVSIKFEAYFESVNNFV